jgi:hypothetical protein
LCCKCRKHEQRAVDTVITEDDRLRHRGTDLELARQLLGSDLWPAVGLNTSPR